MASSRMNRTALDVFHDVLESLEEGHREELDREDLEWLRPAYEALRKQSHPLFKSNI